MGGSHPLREGGQHRDMLERIKPHLSCCALWLTLPPLTRASGGYIKRDGRPRDAETLVSRLVDRPIRPMFTPGWANETQSCSGSSAMTGSIRQSPSPSPRPRLPF